MKVLFVCLGNICRSPTAHGVFEKIVENNGLSQQISVDSAGTAAWHIGKAPDSRSMQFARKRGYDLSHLRARQAVADDFNEFDFILAMDKSNLKNLKEICPPNYSGHLGLFLDFATDKEFEVPDPYYGGDAGFDRVLDLVEDGSKGLLKHIISKLS